MTLRPTPPRANFSLVSPGDPAPANFSLVSPGDPAPANFSLLSPRDPAPANPAFARPRAVNAGSATSYVANCAVDRWRRPKVGLAR